MNCILVTGAGDVGSAIAHALRTTRRAVVLHDVPLPAHPRRGMAFTDAFFVGRCSLAGVEGVLCHDLAELRNTLDNPIAVPVISGTLAECVRLLGPVVLVDARMRKYAPPDRLRGLAPLTVGLGPGFVVGRDADLVVETAWGERLGALVANGAAQAPSGQPNRVAGHGRERFLYAPVSGTMRTHRAIGGIVRSGTRVGTVGDCPLVAPFAGCLRGLTRDGALVEKGGKVAEVDADGDARQAFGLGERPVKIAAAVLRTIDAAAA